MDKQNTTEHFIPNNCDGAGISKGKDEVVELKRRGLTSKEEARPTSLQSNESGLKRHGLPSSPMLRQNATDASGGSESCDDPWAVPQGEPAWGSSDDSGERSGRQSSDS